MQSVESKSATHEDNDSREVTREYVEGFLKASATEISLSDTEKERFIAMAITYQLNPYKREIHVRCTDEQGKRKVRFIVGYEVYIKKAERTGLLDGWKVWIEGSGAELKAIVEIQRKDWKCPFQHEVYWLEAVQRRDDGSVIDFWERMPRFQLKKVAISQGFRLCFSDEIGGIPYDPSEITVSFESSCDLSSEKKDHPNQSETSVPSLVETVHNFVLRNKDILSDTHLEWIENQLRQEKTEAQLRGLLKHVQEAIDSGGDRSNERKRGNTCPSYPRPAAKTTKPRLPVNYPRPPVPQDAAIF